MKTLGKLKLNQFSKAELDQRALNALKGGCGCGGSCSCSASSCGSTEAGSVDVDNASYYRPGGYGDGGLYNY